jgi:acyl-CoA synthetase (AMP-forming)/AMP-acid ligase II
MPAAGAATRAALQAAGGRPMLHDLAGGYRSGDDLIHRVDELAAALAARGLAGRRIGLWYRNGLAAIEAFLAVEWIGATRVPVDPDAAAAEAVAVFDSAGCAGVLVDSEHAGAAPAGALVHDDDAPLRGSDAFRPVEVEPSQVLHLYPRMAAGGQLFGVPISYGNWDATMRVNEELFRSGRYGPGFDDDECFLTAQQLMHGTGLIGSFPFLRMGVPQVLLPRFSADSAIEACERRGVTATFFVPGMLTRLVDRLAERRTSVRLRHVLYGGAPIGAAEIRDAVAALGPVLTQLYGRLEGGWPLAILDIDDHAAIVAGDDRRASSCGRPVAEVEARLRPIAGRPDAGELCVRSDMVVADYAEADGWCALGDVAVLDDGYIYLRGRLDGMINTGSYHVYPAEIEQAISAVPGVRAVMVRGEPDPTWGHVVTAYIVAGQPDDDSLLPRVQAQLPGRLARYKLPKAIHLVTTLPGNS